MYFLVLNLGLKSIRAILFDARGNKIATNSIPISTYLKGDQVEQHPGEWWEKGKAVIRTTIQDKNIRRKIRYITVTSSSSCLVPVDKEGRELCKAIMVSDKRAVEQCKKIKELDVFREVYKKTGLLMEACLMTPKILWLKENEKALFNLVYKYLSPNDYLVSKLTGKYITDYFNAEKYHFDSLEKKYPGKLLRELGIPESTMPDVFVPGTNIGTLKKEVLDEFDLPEDINLVLSTYDAICAFLGSGPSDEGEACDVSGTVTSFRTLSKKKINRNLDKIFVQFFTDRGFFVIGGSNNLGGGLIEWAKQCFYPNQDYPYEIMEGDARESNLGANGLIFLPYLMGERTPLWDCNARGVFFGLERYHTRKDIVRAIFESIGFGMRSILEIIEESGVQVKNIRVSGGLSRIDYISHLKADITGKEILVTDEFETTSLGAFMLVGLGTGLFRNFKEASEETVRIREILKPNPTNFHKYSEIYSLFKNTYNALAHLFIERKGIMDKIYLKTEERIENL